MYKQVERTKNTKTCPKNFTQPILVRKSYRYRGMQPLITIKNINDKVTFIENIEVKSKKRVYKVVVVGGVSVQEVNKYSILIITSMFDTIGFNVSRKLLKINQRLGDLRPTPPFFFFYTTIEPLPTMSS